MGSSALANPIQVRYLGFVLRFESKNISTSTLANVASSSEITNVMFERRKHVSSDQLSKIVPDACMSVLHPTTTINHLMLFFYILLLFFFFLYIFVILCRINLLGY